VLDETISEKNDDSYDLDKRDMHGAPKALRDAINLKYDVTEVLGKGSYGCVSKGICKATGRVVALKVMVEQASTEYDCTKLLREIQLFKRLNHLSESILRKLEGQGTSVNGKGLFVPELIDIITPISDQKSGKCPSSGGA